MDELEFILKNPHIHEVFLVCVAAIITVKFIIGLVDWFRERFGISTATSRREQEQSERIAKIEEETEELQKTQEKDHEEMRSFQNKIMDALNGIRKSMLDDKIERMRYEILDFGNACQKRDYNKESYDHVLQTYDKYVEVLKDNDLENGQVDLAIAYIKKRYAEYLENGFPTY